MKIKLYPVMENSWKLLPTEDYFSYFWVVRSVPKVDVQARKIEGLNKLQLYSIYLQIRD